ncbi:hypothetical protein D1164_07640 [Mariniphaga sediminis]|uniref:Uncharacterized protein n=1 Tax=Mariniphaga sediminis TaxID=1628158 RepID=A0A399D239_9BACT|nr:hypothetical protein [Mariniphaga sediminis]RIH65536.1 hypothetical protein D1164_07640 [Mariniphaga sediminis]
MNNIYSRRNFVKTSAVGTIGVSSGIPLLGQTGLIQGTKTELNKVGENNVAFIPNRVASWWCTLEDLLWPQKKIVDKIKRRAEGFANAKIDTALNFGFHIRFDYSNYFGHLHGYYANVCEELHKYDIKFMDHYSCNHVERPRSDSEFRKLHHNHRHSVLLFHDPIAAENASYEGHRFNDICQVNLVDGSRGYAPQYQMEAFCHNNPDFLDMHQKYLQRLIGEVPLDAIEVDDMCDYAGLVTCGCKYCRDRYKKEYGRELPSLNDISFWGDTKRTIPSKWGNYENPAFRDWVNMRTNSVADHLKMVKETIKDKPLMTCCSSSGPISLNSISLNLERMSPYLDFFMLENCGINVKSVSWVPMDAEAMHQKDIAQKRGNAPAMALSYTIYGKGGYMGWSLSRFWGVSNWGSTLNGRLEEDPTDMMEIEDIVGPLNNWELKNSDLNYMKGSDLVEVRLVNSRYCRDNGWRDSSGHEQWEKAAAWSERLVKANVGYRFVRCEELADSNALCRESTPLILDGVGCVSDAQFKAVKIYLSKGAQVWFALPFGTHDEKGFKRTVPLSEELLKMKDKNLSVIDSVIDLNPLGKLIEEGNFQPVIKQLSGDERWAVRIRFQDGKPVLHFMNTALKAIPHPIYKDHSNNPILKDIHSDTKDDKLVYEINTKRVALPALLVKSPELEDNARNVNIENVKRGYLTIHVDLSGVKVYAVAQNG